MTEEIVTGKSILHYSTVYISYIMGMGGLVRYYFTGTVWDRKLRRKSHYNSKTFFKFLTIFLLSNYFDIL